MMLWAVPPWIMPTVSTAGWNGSTFRATTCCSRVMICAAVTTGSTVWWGQAPCPPRPVTVTRSSSGAAMTGPDAKAMRPASR